jgi:hypothetical protein
MGKGAGAQVPVQLVGLAVGVDLHLAEIGPETGLHLGAEILGQRVPPVLEAGQPPRDVVAGLKALDSSGPALHQRLSLKQFFLLKLALDQRLSLKQVFLLGLALDQRLSLKQVFLLGLALDQRLSLKQVFLLKLALDQRLSLKQVFLLKLALHQWLSLKQVFLLKLALDQRLPLEQFFLFRLALHDRGDRGGQRFHLNLFLLLSLYRRPVGRGGHSHHLLCHTVCLLLVLIPYRANPELGLNRVGRGSEQSRDSPVAIGALQGKNVIWRG